MERVGGACREWVEHRLEVGGAYTEREGGEEIMMIHNGQ